MSAGRPRPILALCLLLLAVASLPACAPVRVDTTNLTLERYPPRRSAAEVAFLAHPPKQGYREVADVTVRQRNGSFETLQERLREEAAKLGADAIILGGRETHVKEGVGYQPIYNPWGRRSPYYGPPSGPYGYGYGGLGYGRPLGYVAVPYEVEILSLQGTAIRYLD